MFIRYSSTRPECGSTDYIDKEEFMLLYELALFDMGYEINPHSSLQMHHIERALMGVYVASLAN